MIARGITDRIGARFKILDGSSLVASTAEGVMQRRWREIVGHTSGVPNDPALHETTPFLDRTRFNDLPAQ